MSRFGGGKFKSSGKPSLEQLTRCAAILYGLGSLKKTISQIRPRRHQCEIIHQLHFKCMIDVPKGQFNSFCDLLFQRNEKCRDYKSRWKESIQKKATAEGFASAEEYYKHQETQDPKKCKWLYKQYKECISKGYRNCGIYRNGCPQFKVP